jgi:hypothetical protein
MPRSNSGQPIGESELNVQNAFVRGGLTGDRQGRIAYVHCREPCFFESHGRLDQAVAGTRAHIQNGLSIDVVAGLGAEELQQ